MTDDELAKMSPAFQAGYRFGSNPGPRPTHSATWGDREVSEFWWGYHKGRKAKTDYPQKRLIP